ncbi:two-component GAP Byr4 [Gigaspora margarita]|uniref:Two-component GAP Byr4 n=1 Tax=Gigaspora margarita TaxID=4874 RepID=A0A8H3X143_GIGMA|nr:two-component GAP Byr4 [Gigaspora margarita]
MLPILNTTVKKFPLAQIESDEENWDDIEIPSSGLMVIDNTSEDDIEDVGKISTNDMSDDVSTSSKIVRRNDELNAAVKAMIGDLNNSLSNKEFTGTITMLGNPKKVVDMDDWDNDMEIPEDGLSFSDPSKSSSFNFINYNVKRIDNPSTFPRISTENVVESLDQDFELMDSNDLNFSTDALKVYGGDDDDNYSAFDSEGGNDIMSGGFYSRDSPRDSLRDSPRDSLRDSPRDSPRGSLRDSLGGSPRFNVIVSPDPSSSNFESEDESFDDLQIPDEQLTLFPPRREYQNSPLSRSDTIIKDNSMDYKLDDDDDDIGEDNFWSGLDVQYDNAFEPDNIKNKNIVSKSVLVQYKRPRRQSFTIEFSPSLISDSLMNIDDPHSFDINSSDEFSHSKDSSSTSEKSTTSSTSKNSKSSSSSLSKKVTKKNCLSSLETPPSSPTKVTSNSKNNIISKRPSNISSKTSPPSKKYKSNISKTPDSPKSTSSSSSSKEKDSTTTKSSTKSSAKSVGKSVTNSVTNLKSVANSVTKSVTKNSTTSKPRTLSTSKALNTNVTSIKENFNPLTKSKKIFVASSKSLTNKLLDSTKLSKMASSPSLKTTKISDSSSLTKHANISSISLASVKTHHSLPSVPSKKSNFTTTVSSSKTSKSLLNSSKPTHSHVKSAPSLSVISTVNKINNSKKNQKSCGSKTLRIMLKPNNSQNYGDGTELDVFDDLPICLDKERAYKIYPASPIFDANSGILSDRKNIASSIGSKALSKSNAESRRSSTSSKKKNRQKKPHLIRNLNSEKGTKVVGEMVYNPILQRWDGNELALKDFDSSPQRPALISNMNPQSTNTKSLHMVGRMIFDPIKMSWFHSSAKDNNNSMSSEEEELLALFDSEEEIDLENTESAKNTDGFDESSKFKCHTSSGELLGMNNSRNDELWDATSLVFSDGDHNEIVYSAEGRRRRRIIATGNGNKQTNDNDNVFETNEFQVGSEFDVSKGFLANLVASERQHKKEMNRWYSAIRSISNEQRFGLKDRNYQRGFLYEIRNPNIVNSIITLNSGKHKKYSSSGSK